MHERRFAVDFGFCGGLTMGRGGWRYGAGRPSWRIKAEACLRLDIRELARARIFSASSLSWTWRRSDTGEAVGSISIFARGLDTVTLAYSVNDNTVRDDVEIERTPCHYGGARPWFICPRCSRRSATLFLRGGRFKCRPCAGVAYSSQSEDALDRAWRRQRKIESRLDKDWARPKGMHQRTRASLLERIFDCEAAREDALTAYLRARGIEL